MGCVYNHSSVSFLLFVFYHLSRESAENCYIPNGGFLEDVVFEDPALFSAAQASDSCEDDSSVGQTNAINNEHMGDAGVADGPPSISDSASTGDPAVTNEVSEQITAAMVDLQVVENAPGIESNVDDQHSLSVEDVDMLLDKCLLQALHTTVKEKDLPMPGSVLWYPDTEPRCGWLLPEVSLHYLDV